MSKKLAWGAIFLLAVAVICISVTNPEWVIVPPPFTVASSVSAATDKCYSNCTDPNRPQYDAWGNEYDYQGSLIKAAPCTVDPITGQPNPASCKVNQDNSITPVQGFGGK